MSFFNNSVTGMEIIGTLNLFFLNSKFLFLVEKKYLHESQRLDGCPGDDQRAIDLEIIITLRHFIEGNLNSANVCLLKLVF